MPTQPIDLLARHKETSGFLKGKILSDTSIPVRRSVRLLMFKQFGLPTGNAAFKAYCERCFNIGFNAAQRFPNGVQNFIESGYRGNPKIGGCSSS